MSNALGKDEESSPLGSSPKTLQASRNSMALSPSDFQGELIYKRIESLQYIFEKKENTSIEGICDST